MCKDVVEAKRRDLRVRDDYPSARVRPPERGEPQSKQYLYPSEFLRLVSCEGIKIAFLTAPVRLISEPPGRVSFGGTTILG